ncbi:MAG: LON peptidase substrate-binding domain-containing protein [Alphaproteobacteria bacterium]
MARGPFAPTFEELPEILPIFPLENVLLLPHGILPLNIFEPRYLAMTRDSLGGARMIGMIQPNGTAELDNGPVLFDAGCAGRIVSFSETPDGRYLITLSGTCRFNIADELPLQSGYRRVVPDFTHWRGDLDAPAVAGIDSARLIELLERYLTVRQANANWNAIKDMEPGELVTSIAMTCPFDAGEKQALLEAPDLAHCSEILTALLEMALSHDDSDTGATRH